MTSNGTPGGTPGPGEYVDENGNGQWDPGEEQIVTVTGVRPNEVDDGDGGEGGAPWEPDPGGDTGGAAPGTGMGGPALPPPGEDDIAQRVTIDPSVPADQRERAEQVEQELEQKMREIDQKIQALDDNEIVTIDGKNYTGAEIKALWSQMTYVITLGQDFGPLGGAQNNNGEVRANLSTLEVILPRTNSPFLYGVDDMFLHELAHLLPADIDNYAAQWRAYRDSGGSLTIPAWQASPNFQAAERYTHRWASAIGARAGVVGYGS